MKISIIEPVGGYSGMDYYDYGLALGLGYNNLEVLLLTSSKTIIREYTNVETVRTFSNVWETKNKFIRLWYFILGYLRSLNLSKKRGVKIIHLHFFDLGFLNCLVVFFASTYKFKKVLTLHDISSFDKTNKFRSSNELLEKWLLKRFDKIIVHNELSKIELVKKNYPQDKIEVIPHGNYLPFVNELSYDPKNSEPLKILFFGQIKEVKGLDVLLESLALLKLKTNNFRLIVAGKPWHDNIQKYEKLLLELHDHINVRFEYIPNDETQLYFENADVIILPYKKIYQSGVLLLTMSYNRPVIVSNLKAFSEIIDDDVTGIVFESENPSSLCQKLLPLTLDKLPLKVINENSNNLIKDKYNWNQIGLKTKLVYKNIL
jgi:D-inositol-3-phosphate glycosyltransferase